MRPEVNRKQRWMQISLLDLLMVSPAFALTFIAINASPESGAILFATTLALSSSCLIGACFLRRHAACRWVAKYAIACLALLVFYAASFGPACWLMTSPTFAPFRSAPVSEGFYKLYGLAGVSYAHTPKPLNVLAVRYLKCWVHDDDLVDDHGWGIKIIIDGNMSVVGI